MREGTAAYLICADLWPFTLRWLPLGTATRIRSSGDSSAPYTGAQHGEERRMKVVFVVGRRLGAKVAIDLPSSRTPEMPETSSQLPILKEFF